MTFDEMLHTDSFYRVAIVQADHGESLKTMSDSRRNGRVEFVLIGNRARIEYKANDLRIPLEGVEIREAESDEEAVNLAAEMAEAGEVDVLMKGLVHTSIFTRALLNRDRKLISPGGLISHAGIFDLPGLAHPFILTDAAVNIAPDRNDKAAILNNALTLSRSLGVKAPHVVCVAPIETVNPKIQSTVDARELSVRDFGNAIVEGPMALDAALSRKAAEIKGIDSRVAGEPDILLFPDLNSANCVYKAFSFYPGCRYAGILTGLKVPVVLTSRSDPKEVRSLSLKLAMAGTCR